MNAAADRPLPAVEAAAAWTALAGETYDAWTCACEAWVGYLGRLATASGPADVLEAGARLSLESVEICSRVAAHRLGGLRAPLLNDA